MSADNMRPLSITVFAAGFALCRAIYGDGVNLSLSRILYSLASKTTAFPRTFINRSISSIPALFSWKNSPIGNGQLHITSGYDDCRSALFTSSTTLPVNHLEACVSPPRKAAFSSLYNSRSGNLSCSHSLKSRPFLFTSRRTYPVDVSGMVDSVSPSVSSIFSITSTRPMTSFTPYCISFSESGVHGYLFSVYSKSLSFLCSTSYFCVASAKLMLVKI